MEGIHSDYLAPYLRSILPSFSNGLMGYIPISKLPVSLVYTPPVLVGFVRSINLFFSKIFFASFVPTVHAIIFIICVFEQICSQRL